MNLQALQKSITEEARFSFARSSGPGGQNVNKVNSKVFLEIELSSLKGLTEQERFLIAQRLKGRISGTGVFFLSVDEDRSQIVNKERSLQRATQLIVQASQVPKKRIKTKPKKSSIQKRLNSKAKISLIKQLRQKPSQD